MDNIFVIAGIIAVIFFIVKFLEMRFVDKESKPLKFLVRDTLVVYVSVVAGNFIYEQVTPVLEQTVATTSSPIAFTDNHRLAIASPGGTPATNTALLVAAVLYSRTQFKELNETSRTNLVRHIHVPGPNAQNQTQSLIEFDADDLQWLSKLMTTD